jgi:hypothetical protein
MDWADAFTLEPVYEIPKLDGKGMTKRIPPSRARDLDLVPRVTGIIHAMLGEGVGLRKYKEKNLIDAASGNMQAMDERDADYMERILSLAYVDAKDARDRGRAVHAAIDLFLRGGAADGEPAAAEAIIELTQFLETVKPATVEPEKTLGGLGLGLGFAGTPDIVLTNADLAATLSLCDRTPYLEGEGTVVIDLKTTNLRTFKRPYREWRYQFGGYHRLLQLGAGTTLFVQWLVDPHTGESKWLCYDDVDRWRSAFDGIWQAWRMENEWV